jgi:drug/metabolite transporter (DMT)-like permease
MARQHPIVIAAAWMLGTLASFMAMAIGGRELSATLGTFEILFFRSLFGLALISYLVARRGWQPTRTRRLGLHTMRNVAHFAGQFGWFYGIAYIPLASVFAIEFTLPVWTAILAAFLLGERMSATRLIAIACGILGMVIILRPGTATMDPAALAVLFGAVSYALAHTLTRRLAQTEHPITILFYMTLIQLPLGLVPSLAAWITPAGMAWLWLLGVAVAALTGHYCLTRALMLADATVVVPMDFMRLPLIAVVGLLFYDEPLDWHVLAGALIILAGNLLNINAERAAPPAAAQRMP